MDQSCPIHGNGPCDCPTTEMDEEDVDLDIQNLEGDFGSDEEI